MSVPGNSAFPPWEGAAAATNLANARRSGLMSKADKIAHDANTAKLATLMRPVSRLDVALAADIATLAWAVAGTGQTVVAAQNFTVGSAAALLLPFVSFAAQVSNTAATKWGLAAVIDGATTIPIGGATHNANDFATLMAGPFRLPALAAGVHTIKIDAVANTAGASLAFRPATQPLYEFCRITIYEVAP